MSKRFKEEEIDKLKKLATRIKSTDFTDSIQESSPRYVKYVRHILL